MPQSKYTERWGAGKERCSFCLGYIDTISAPLKSGSLFYMTRTEILFFKKVPMIMERNWHDSRASKCTVGPVQGPSQGHGMLCLKTEKIQHAA